MNGDDINSKASPGVSDADGPGRPANGRILVVDDEKNIRASLEMVLGAQGYMVDVAADGDAAEKIMSITPPDAIMLDVRLPGRSGIELLKTWKASFPQIPIILMSGEATLTEALDGVRIGAYDFIEKPFLQPRLINTLSRALEKTRLVESRLHAGTGDIVGSSPKLVRVLDDLRKIAPLRTRVLIIGESGTGKDLLAKALHEGSTRAGKRYVKVNCAAIPADLIESELFGHVKGAFTGASAARRGVFEMANGGTLFLDEVGELSPAAQAKILRALQNAEITPVGSNITINVDVRVIAATNRDLAAEVELGNFREDLYYRLAVVTLASPPLRERSSDIGRLTEHFAAQICRENGIPDKRLSAAVLGALETYRWPGNIRELRNVIERLMILGGPVININDLPPEIAKAGSDAAPRSVGAGNDATHATSTSGSFSPKTWEDFKSESERSYLIEVLRHTAGNISEAARVLNVERTTIHKWLKSWQIAKHHYQA